MTAPLRPWARGAVPAPTGSEAAAFDRAAIEGRSVPEAALMESAGRAAADLAGHLAPAGGIVILAGTGNNGGDGVVAARTLRARGREVRVVVVGERTAPDPLLHGWDLPLLRAADLGHGGLEAVLREADLVVDAILGTGIRGAPREPAAGVIGVLADHDGPVLALDVPSGVVADTGAVPGVAARATVTLGFGWPKLGALLEPGRSRAGRVMAAEIGFPPAPADAFGARLLTPAWWQGVRPRREPATHKNRVGAVLVVGGGPGMAGAAVLSARAALRAGAGFVRVAAAEGHRVVVQATLPDAPFVALDDLEGLVEALEASRGAVAGPGLGTGPEAEAALEAALSRPIPLVVDADGLNLLAAGRPRRLNALGPGPRVLTPHPGEAARLLGCAVDEVEADRPGTARRLVEASGAVIVLKGTPTLVAAPGLALGVAGIASSDFAVAGMGDVLAGATASLLAQGLAPADAAGAALHVCGRAALRTGLGPGLTASDVPDALPGALGETGRGHTDVPFPWLTLDLDAPR